MTGTYLMESTYLYDEFTTLTAGVGFKLFPFGRVYKGGKARDITPEFAKTIKLPHFTAPIKLGSHDDATPAGGFITALEVREDGLYAIPEWNEAGKKAIENGAFRFNSPEIIWEGGLENPKTGDIIRAPMIIGDALLHTPHLGNDAALYSVEPITQEINNMQENISVPAGLWDKFTAFLDSKLTPVEPKVVEVIPEDYTAAKQERDEYKAKLAEREQADALKVRVDKFNTDLKEINVNPDLAGLLADLPEDKAEQVMKQFRAMSEQVKASALIEEAGTEGAAVEDPKAQFNALVLKYSAEKKIGYNQAFDIVKAENPELFTAWAVKEK